MRHGIILFILNYQAQFLSTYQTKVHSNPDIKLFTRFIKNFGHLRVDQIVKKSKQMDENHPKVHEFDNFFEQ